MQKKLIIFGTGEMSEIANYYFSSHTDYQILGFTINEDYLKEDNFCKRPVIPFENIEKIYPPSSLEMHVALSYTKMNQLREQKYLDAKKKGYKLINFISTKSYIQKDVIFGDNCFILENQTIQKNVIIGSNVMVWSSNHIGHGTKINDHTYLSSHVVISGNCEVGKRCFFGVNSSVADFCKIGNDCFIGMGANVSRNLEDEMSAVSNVTKYFDKDNKVLNIIKKKYFKF